MIRCGVVLIDALDIGCDDEKVGGNLGGQQTGGPVLVDDRLYAFHRVVARRYDRNAAAAGANDHRIVFQQPADRTMPKNALGARGWNDPAPFFSIELELPTMVLGLCLRLFLIERWTDEFARICEFRVVWVNLHTGQDGGDRYVIAEEIAEFLFENVTDHPTRGRTHDIEGIGRSGLEHFRLHRQKSDLRPVAMGQDQLMRTRHRLKRARCDPRVFPLGGGGGWFVALHQCVAAQCYDYFHDRLSSRRAGQCIKVHIMHISSP